MSNAPKRDGAWPFPGYSPGCEGFAGLVRLLRRGGTACLPTDTTYGLIARAAAEAAVERVYRLKGRPRDKALVCLIGAADWVERYCEPRKDNWLIPARRFWPGPLNLVLPAGPQLPRAPLAGGRTVALRVPDDELLLELLAVLNEPLVAPSANPAGKPPALSVDQAYGYFGEDIPCYVDGGSADSSVVSTIIDLVGSPPRLLRQGRISPEELRRLPGLAELVLSTRAR
ncbi:MAG: threonylcarbamoyl-AMP synthase [Candidatus Coatesbacteria bacterium]|nr:threonylcarbamoyl-AMP synthase [Candidatus Coatesbacteria bacterium]